MIEAKHLIKRFGQVIAVDDVSLTVGRGEVLGFLGPNAAGKSTTMRMITGFLLPTSGTVIIGGDDIIESSLSARKKIGYLPENAPLYPEMSVIGFLKFIAEIRGFSGHQKAKKIEEIIEKCFLSEVCYQTINTLSKGFRQRVCFAQSILHDPEYLIMDEPTDGLDPNQKHQVCTMIREMAKDKTIIISTHILEEMETICTRAVVIANGKIVADDTPEGLKARALNHGVVCITIKNKGTREPDFVQSMKGLEGVKAIEVLSTKELKTTFRVFPQDPRALLVDKIIPFIMDKGYALESFFVESGHLDEVFRTITTPLSGGRQDEPNLQKH